MDLHGCPLKRLADLPGGEKEEGRGHLCILPIGKVVSPPQCGRRAHKACLGRWLQGLKRPSCPLGRLNLDTAHRLKVSPAQQRLLAPRKGMLRHDKTRRKGGATGRGDIKRIQMVLY